MCAFLHSDSKKNDGRSRERGGQKARVVVVGKEAGPILIRIPRKDTHTIGEERSRGAFVVRLAMMKRNGKKSR